MFVLGSSLGFEHDDQTSNQQPTTTDPKKSKISPKAITSGR